MKGRDGREVWIRRARWSGKKEESKIMRTKWPKWAHWSGHNAGTWKISTEEGSEPLLICFHIISILRDMNKKIPLAGPLQLFSSPAVNDTVAKKGDGRLSMKLAAGSAINSASICTWACCVHIQTLMWYLFAVLIYACCRTTSPPPHFVVFAIFPAEDHEATH